MKNKNTTLLILAISLVLTAAPAPSAEFWPDDKGWPKAKPEEAGISAQALEQAPSKMQTPIGTAIVIRGGRDVWHYGDPYAIQGDGGWASCERSYLTALFGIAIKEGMIKGGKDSVDLPVKRIDSAAARALGDGVLLKHLLSYTALSDPPGSVWRYNKGYDEMVAILKDLYGKRVEVLAREKLLPVLGGSWEARFNAGIQDHLKIHGTAADAARWGYLWLRGGRWKEQQVVDEWFVKRTLEPMPKPGGGFAEINEGWQIHLNKGGKWAGLPTDSFAAIGGGAKSVIFVSPSLDLVIARIGQATKIEDHIEEFLKPIVDAVRGGPAHQPSAAAAAAAAASARLVSRHSPQTKISIVDGQWRLNGAVTYPDAKTEGLLMNVRMVNAVFEDRNAQTRPKGFDAEASTDAFIAKIPEYMNQGVRAFTLSLQGGMPGYDGAVNSAFNVAGALRDTYLQRVRRVIEACDRHGAVVILSCYYQRQDQILTDEAAVRRGVANTAWWIAESGFTNVMLEVANEFAHTGFDHAILKSPAGEAELIALAKKTAPGLLVSTSGMGSGTLPDEVARASDFLLIHFNTTPLDKYPGLIAALKKYGKPIVCNEDEKVGAEGAKAAEISVANGVSWGFMHTGVNQYFPISFNGAADDPLVYATLNNLTTPKAAEVYFPPPESKGGWRKLDQPDEIRRLAGMDPNKLAELKDWLLQSDKRDFAAVVIRNGYIVLEVERGNSAKTDSRGVASVSKAVAATVLAIASEQSQQGKTPRKMKFDDPAFDFIPWAQPLSDPRKAKITIKQLLNHTSGICPEALKPNSDTIWEKILGHTDDAVVAKLAFDPGTASGYSTHAFYHAALVCETVTGKPYDQFAIEALFKPLGIENWWFQFFEGGEKIGRHPSHGLGMPARDLARIGYCMLHEGRWGGRQVIPKWFVDETAAATHGVQGEEMRFKRNAQSFSHGWELPAVLSTESVKGIPKDARYKPGSGGQLLAFVPSLDLVIARQTGSSGKWEYEEYLRRACEVVLSTKVSPHP